MTCSLVPPGSRLRYLLQIRIPVKPASITNNFKEEKFKGTMTFTVTVFEALCIQIVLFDKKKCTLREDSIIAVT